MSVMMCGNGFQYMYSLDVCIWGSVQYSWSHCPVLLHVHLHFKLFIIGQIKMDGWMDGGHVPQCPSAP